MYLTGYEPWLFSQNPRLRAFSVAHTRANPSRHLRSKPSRIPKTTVDGEADQVTTILGLWPIITGDKLSYVDAF